MGRPVAEHHQEADAYQALSELYGASIPATAWLLEHNVACGRIRLRTADGEVRVVDLRQATAEFGDDLVNCGRHLHHLHVLGQLTVEEDGTVRLPLTAGAEDRCRPGTH